MGDEAEPPYVKPAKIDLIIVDAPRIPFVADREAQGDLLLAAATAIESGRPLPNSHVEQTVVKLLRDAALSLKVLDDRSECQSIYELIAEIADVGDSEDPTVQAGIQAWLWKKLEQQRSETEVWRTIAENPVEPTAREFVNIQRALYLAHARIASLEEERGLNTRPATLAIVTELKPKDTGD